MPDRLDDATHSQSPAGYTLSAVLADEPKPAALPGESAGTVVAGRYTLQECVGAGGMGTVWRATQSTPVKRDVALKLIRAGFDTRTVLARFEAERQALAVMDHPNIAKILDGGVTEAGRPFFVMELVAGPPITDYCDARKLTPDARLRLFVAACEAIQHAHQKGVVHRDIKPSNVLVCELDGKPVPKVIDFGLAKAVGQPLTDSSLATVAGAIIGTPAYMSPEQASLTGADIDTRSDVYSLGVLLYELLAGSPPFAEAELKRAGVFEMLRVVREVEPPRPSDKLSGAGSVAEFAANRSTEPKRLTGLLRSELDWVVLKAIEKDRARRYDAPSDLANDVRRYLGGEPVTAHPPSADYRLRMLVRRNKVAVLAGSLVAITLVAGLAGTTWGLVRAVEARKGEMAAREVAEAREKEADGERAKAVAAVQAEAERRREADAERVKAVVAAEAESRQRKEAEAANLRAENAARGEIAAREVAQANEARALAAAASEAEQRKQADAQRVNALAAAAAEAKQRKEAEAANLRAMTALKSFTDEVMERQLASKDRPSDTERAVLRKALEQWTVFADSKGATPAGRAVRAEGLFRVARVQTTLGMRAEAEANFRASVDLYSDLASDEPVAPAHRAGEATARSNLALLVSRSDRTGAEREFRTALALREALATKFPDDADHRDQLSMTHNNFGVLLRGAGDKSGAEREFRVAVALGKSVESVGRFDYRTHLAAAHNNLGLLLCESDRVGGASQFRDAALIFEKLVAEEPAAPQPRAGLAAARCNLAALLMTGGDKAGAEREYLAAAESLERLAADFPGAPEHLVNWGGTCGNYGNLLRSTGRAAESLSWFDKAIKALTAARKRDSESSSAALFLRNSHWSRAETLTSLGKYVQSLTDWDRAVELSPAGDQPLLKAERTLPLAKAGRAKEAVTQVAELTSSQGWDADKLYDFARVYAIACTQIPEKRSDYAALSLSMLQKVKGNEAKKTLTTDPEFAPARDVLYPEKVNQLPIVAGAAPQNATSTPRPDARTAGTGVPRPVPSPKPPSP